MNVVRVPLSLHVVRGATVHPLKGNNRDNSGVMGRWNENNNWKELKRWLAAVTLGFYVAFTLYAIFIYAEPFSRLVAGGQWGMFRILVKWIFRIMALLNLVGVIWMCMKLIDHQEGEWPN